MYSVSSLPSSLRIGVLRGGPSPEYDASLQSGGHVLKHLSETHRPLDIFISKDGAWHMRGIPRAPEKILKNVDVVFNALYGCYGQDGQVQEILDYHGVPYTGSDKYPSAIAINKWLTKNQAKNLGIKTPISILVRKDNPIGEKAREIFHEMPHPLMVKPVMGYSSVGIHKVESFPELLNAIENVLSEYNSVIVEEYISGKEAACAVINNFRGQNIYVLPTVEIIPPLKKDFFDYETKYSGQSREICPGNFTADEKKEIERISALIHNGLGLRHYSRSDFIVSPRRGIYFLGVNTLPKMTEKSLIPKSLESVGVSIKEFIHHLVLLALNEK